MRDYMRADMRKACTAHCSKTLIEAGTTATEVFKKTLQELHRPTQKWSLAIDGKPRVPSLLGPVSHCAQPRVQTCVDTCLQPCGRARTTHCWKALVKAVLTGTGTPALPRRTDKINFFAHATPSLAVDAQSHVQSLLGVPDPSDFNQHEYYKKVMNWVPVRFFLCFFVCSYKSRSCLLWASATTAGTFPNVYRRTQGYG